MVRFKYNLVGLIILVTASVAFASNPLPDIYSNKYLFKIERSRDFDEIIYELNFDEKGSLLKTNPIKISWIRYTDHQKREALTLIQQRYAYGLKFLDEEETAEKEWRFQFVAYHKQTFILKQSDDLSFKVFTVINNKEVQLSRIYIQFENRSFWFPSISAVELYCAHTNEYLAETITP